MTQGTSGPGQGWALQGPPEYGASAPEPAFTQPGYAPVAPPQATQPQPEYPQPGYSQPGYPQPTAAQPTYPQPGYARPGYPQPGYPQPGYPQPGYPQQYYAPAPPKAPAIAVVGLVLAIVMPLVGLIVSLVALPRARRAGAGRGLAITGVVIGGLLTLATAALVPFIVRAAGDISGAREAVEDTNDAIATEDCDLFMERTTENFRSLLAISTCDDFASVVDMLNEGPIPVGNVPITDVEVSGDTAVVRTLERVTPGFGDASMQAFDYTVIRVDGRWLVDDVVPGD